MPPDPPDPTPPTKPSTPRVKRDLQAPRTVSFVIRLRPSERDQLAAHAASHGLTLAELCRHRLLEWQIPRPSRQVADAKMYGVLSQISVSLRNSSNNLNQLTKAHHLGFPPGMEDVARAMKELQSEVDELRLKLSSLQGAIDQAPSGQTRWPWVEGYSAGFRAARHGA